MFRHFYSVLFYTLSAAASTDDDAGSLSPFDPAISCTWIVCTRPRRGQVAWMPEASTAATVKMTTAISDDPPPLPTSPRFRNQVHLIFLSLRVIPGIRVSCNNMLYCSLASNDDVRVNIKWWSEVCSVSELHANVNGQGLVQGRQPSRGPAPWH